MQPIGLTSLLALFLFLPEKIIQACNTGHKMLCVLCTTIEKLSKNNTELQQRQNLRLHCYYKDGSFWHLSSRESLLTQVLFVFPL